MSKQEFACVLYVIGVMMRRFNLLQIPVGWLKVKTVAGTSEEFEIKVDVHLGSALSPLLIVVRCRKQEEKQEVRIWRTCYMLMIY